MLFPRANKTNCFKSNDHYNYMLFKITANVAIIIASISIKEIKGMLWHMAKMFLNNTMLQNMCFFSLVRKTIYYSGVLLILRPAGFIVCVMVYYGTS